MEDESGWLIERLASLVISGEAKIIEFVTGTERGSTSDVMTRIVIADPRDAEYDERALVERMVLYWNERLARLG